MLRFKQIAGRFQHLLFAVTLFVPAGTIRWPRAWIFLGVVFVGTAVTMFVLPEELLIERIATTRSGAASSPQPTHLVELALPPVGMPATS
jgi:hypothetical protein